MKLGFIFNVPFHVLTVFQKPVDDMVGAVCYLAMQLAKLGHDITIFSQIANNVDAYGVRCRTMSIENGALNIDQALLEKDYNALIVVNDSTKFLIMLKNSIPSKPKFYFWTSLDKNAPQNAMLNQPEFIAAVDGIICVSEWQRIRFLESSKIPPEKIVSKPYAIAPFFEDLFLNGKEFLELKSKAPSFAFIGNYQDGLEIILDKFADVPSNYPDSTLSVFSDISNASPTQEQQRLFELASHTKKVSYIGLPPKIKLAHMLRPITIFAYPSTIPSTSYLNILHAMAAGLYPIISRAGAGVEYSFGHGKSIAEENLRKDSLDGYLSQVLTICQTQVHSESAFYDYCYKQVVEINKKHTWRTRAREWLSYLDVPTT